jgi:ABC-type branched-subunit amino acid transport system ATPase component/branched-subunit amino acid ABC-type transport system permease component
VTTFIQFAVLGLGISAVYSLLSQGLIVIYGGSGVLNFAQAAMAMLGAYFYWEGRNVAGWGFWPSFLVSVGAVTLLGVVVYQLVMRPLRNASTVARAIASLGVLILIQGIVALKWAELPRNVNAIFPNHVYTVDNIVIPSDRLYLFAIAVALTVVLWAVYRFTPVGLAIRASAENQRAASTLGWSPNMLATITWAVGAGLAGVAGCLIAPITGINPEEMPYYVLPVLAAALLGGFTSFWITLGGALAIGITQSEFAQYVHVWGLSTALPFLVIMVLLVIRGQGLPVRGQVVERLAELGNGIIRWRFLVPIVVAYILAVIYWFPTRLVDSLTVSFSWAVIMLSVVVLLGYAGQLSLAQFALGGIGALMAARLVNDWHWPFELAFLVAVLATIPVGIAFAIPALRTRGINLAVVTLGLAMGVNAMIFTNSRYVGDQGNTDVGPQKFFGINVDPLRLAQRYGVLVFVMFILCALAVANVRRGAVGRRLIAVRTNERAAAALGVSVFGVKMYAFALGSVLAAIGGILLAFRNYNVVYTDFAPLQSILAVAYTVIGGIGFVLGAPFGAQLPAGGFGGWLLDQLFHNPNPSWLVVVGGVSVIALVVLHPDGAISVNAHAFRSLGKKIGAKIKPDRPPVVYEPLPAVPREPVKPATLEAKNITVRFGGVVAVNDVSITVTPGEIVGLIGPNGAGKTTFIDAVTGFVKPSAGEVVLENERVDGWPVFKRARAGLSRSFQQLELFESATVRENLRVASDGHDHLPYLTDIVYPRNLPLSSTATAAVQELELEQYLDERVSDLPYGRRRLVAIARAIAVEPSVLMLDEPAAGLSESETVELGVVVRRLAAEWKLGILVVEHDMSFVMSVCDRIVVLEFGRMIANGTPAEVRRNPAVIAAYLGEPESDTDEPSGNGAGGAAPVAPATEAEAAPERAGH